MALNDNDVDLLHAYLDGELSIPECEGLWRRLTAEDDLRGELDRLRTDQAVRNAVWDSFEPAESATAKVEASILHAARRQDFVAMATRVSRVLVATAACIVVGFSLGRMGQPRTGISPLAIGNTNPSGTAMVSSNNLGIGGGSPANGGNYVVDVRDVSGRVVAQQHFNTLDEVRQFAQDLQREQPVQPEAREPVPAAERF